MTAVEVVDADAFRRAMAQLPTFVTVITTRSPDGPVGCTVNAVVSLSLEPSSVVVSLRTGGRTLEHLRATGAFAVNALAWEQRELCRRFASGDPARRFDGVRHVLRDGVPVLPGAVAVVGCVLEDALEVHDHTLVVGRVVWSTSGEQPALVLRAGEHHRC
ncbi:flavin reductase family protein [Saccharothrix lopnurensis]|uniref:Flavin reductase family protein n=1 Tax=Saccharothrix lopnurensis TaxID=1670621 RepID=A0ABW1PET3_9PSEU